MSDNNEADGSDYAAEVAQYTDEELLMKERSKRRRKTGNLVGTVVTAAAATRAPSLWAAAGSSVKSLLSDNNKHKIIMREIERRGLTPDKGDLKDTIMPILTSAGGMVVGRAVGGPAGDSIGNYAGNIMHSIGNRAFGGSSNRVVRSQTTSVPETSRAVVAAPATAAAVPQVPTLQTPSVYNIGPNETPPATLVYHYVPPSAQYPRGYYAPAPVQPPPPPPAPVTYAQPQVVYQSPQAVYQQPQMYAPPAPASYQYAPPQPQYIQQAPAPAPGGLRRSATIYEAPPPYQSGVQRAHTIVYSG